MNLKIGVSGISGRIGQKITELAKKDNEIKVICGLVSESSKFKQVGVPINSSCAESDIWIDFSTPVALEAVLKQCIETRTPLVTGTTGLSKKHFKEIENAAEVIPVLWASNFAISVNLIQQLLSQYTQLRSSNISITETHHINKVDKPSGTAISLARSIKPHGILKTTDDNEFQLDDVKIKSIRAQDFAGIHEIELDNSSETIHITHTAKTPRIFAQGSINVAKWLVDKPNGFYTMKEYIESL